MANMTKVESKLFHHATEQMMLDIERKATVAISGGECSAEALQQEPCTGLDFDLEQSRSARLKSRPAPVLSRIY